jgi:hypothetical protein
MVVSSTVTVPSVISRRARAAPAAWTALLVALAGCIAGDGGIGAAPDAHLRGFEARPGADGRPAHIVGVVVDTELIPLAGADVVLTPGELVALSDESGAFVFGPLEPGTYTLTAQKRGYASKDQQAEVSETEPTHVRLTLTAIASDVPYHETFSEAMYLICHLVIRNAATGIQVLNAPCGAVDLVTGSTNTLDHWIFFFVVENPGFRSLVMEMVWDPQQLGHDGLMQLSTEGRVSAASGTQAVGVAGTVYGGTMGPPFHAVIHAGQSYWRTAGKNVTFYPEPNATERFKMLVAGGGDNTTLGGSAVFIEFRPTAYLTMFYNRHASPEFSVIPDD